MRRWKALMEKLFHHMTRNAHLNHLTKIWLGIRQMPHCNPTICNRINKGVTAISLKLCISQYFAHRTAQYCIFITADNVNGQIVWFCTDVNCFDRRNPIYFQPNPIFTHANLHAKSKSGPQCGKSGCISSTEVCSFHYNRDTFAIFIQGDILFLCLFK